LAGNWEIGLGVNISSQAKIGISALFLFAAALSLRTWGLDKKTFFADDVEIENAELGLLVEVQEEEAGSAFEVDVDDYNVDK